MIYVSDMEAQQPHTLVIQVWPPNVHVQVRIQRDIRSQELHLLPGVVTAPAVSRVSHTRRHGDRVLETTLVHCWLPALQSSGILNRPLHWQLTWIPEKSEEDTPSMSLLSSPFMIQIQGLITSVQLGSRLMFSRNLILHLLSVHRTRRIPYSG